MNWMELLGLSGFEDFEKVELNELKVLEQKHRGHVLKAGRRFVAAMLAAAMILPSAAMAAQPTYPLQANRAADGTSVDDPHIEIESNFVHDEFGFLTNTLELAIRVQSPMQDTGNVDENGNPILVPKTSVQAVSVNLAYNTEILHPVSWEWARDERQAVSYDVITNVPHYYDTKLETQKDSRVQTAAATTGIVDTTVHTGYTVTDNIADGKQGLLYFTAHAYKPEPFAEMTTIAVIRFAVEDSVMEHIEIKKKSGDDYTIRYDGVELKDVVDLQGAMAATLPLVEFAQQKDIEDANGKAASAGSTLLYYSDDFTQMNHIPDFDPEDANMVESVKRPINGADYTLDRPNTPQSPTKPKNWNAETLTLACDEAAGTYSYTTNLIHKDNIKFTVVSKKSFMAQEDILGNLTTIVYVDWDNTIIGTQVVPKRTDVRGLVSDHVAENFIYHDDDDKTYNERFDLNNPEQIATAKSVTAEDIVSSLERKYNYRGKYPATGPMGLDSDGNTLHDILGTVVDEMANMPKGRAYPLTNKLDYVFFKRPMTHTDQSEKPDKTDPKYDVTSDPDGSSYEAAYNAWYFAKTEWSQKTAVDSNGDPTSEPYWDVEHPYAYGWALCTVDNYEDVWTTLGMGELGSTAKSTEATSLAAQTGSTMGYSGASFGGYQDLSTAQNTIASVTYDGDAAFAFADLEKGFTDSTVFLKAVYEPGPELINSTNPYRLFRDPYYNKLNTASAASGGAYKIEMLYERSYEDASGVVGVPRMRVPSIRQDTTTDMRWESLPSKGVTNDDMINAPDSDAYTGKTKATYTKADIPNDELITVSLTVSGRQNKVDYYLREGYGANFVEGAPRSVTDNNTRVDGISTLDNYTYYVEGADVAPYYATPRYSERAGTRGFVLYGTLENLMEAATRRNHEELTDTELSDYISTANLEDAHICAADGTAIDRGNISAIRTDIRAAAAAAEAAYNNGKGDAQWWDVEHGHASLTYHQLQHYIISGTLLPDAENELEGDKITWCRVHDECANLTSAKPTDWPGLIAAATNGQKDNITLLTATQIETYFKLRGPNAALWTADTVSTFADKVIAAVTAGATSWDEVQYYLINDAADTSGGVYGQTHYWWYDDPNGATTYTIGNWTDLMGAARDARVNVALPDGSTGKRTAKLSNVEDAFDANAAAAAANPGDTAPAWVSATENLCVNNNGEPFASFTDFTDKLTAALDALEAAGYTSPDWWQVQYVILGGSAVSALPKSNPNAPSDYATYWWHNGGAKIVDIPTLIKAGRDGNDAALSMLDETVITASPFNLRKSFKGEEYTAADMADFITKIKNVPNEVSTWNHLQYYLIHGNYDATAAGRETRYYWWSGGGSATPIDIYTTDDLITVAFRAIYNGNTKTWDDLTAQQIEDLNLRLPVPNGSGEIVEETFDALPKITDVDAFKSDIADLIAKYYTDNGITHTHTPPAETATTWYQIQKWLITKEYDTATSEADFAQVYWWKDGGNSPNAKTSFDKLIGYLQDYAGDDPNAIANNVDEALLTDVGSTGFRSTATSSSFGGKQLTQVKTKLQTLVTNLSAAGKTPADLTWANIQYAILNNGDYGSAYYTWDPTLTELDHVLWAMVLYKRDGNTTTFEERISADRLVSNQFRSAITATSSSFGGKQLTQARTKLTTLLNSLTEEEIFALTWGQVQYALINNGAYTTDPADYDNYSWDPTKPATAAELFMLNMMALDGLAMLTTNAVANSAAPTTKTSTSEDGLTTTTTTTRRIYDWEENTLTFIMTDVTTVIDGNRKIVTTVERVLAIDLDTGESAETVGAPFTEIIENEKTEEGKKEEGSMGNKVETDRKDEVYTITPDTEIKTPETNTASPDTDTAADDNDSQSSSVTVPEEAEHTVPAQNEAEADVPMQTLPQEPGGIAAPAPAPDIEDDSRSQSASDPPDIPEDSLTAPPLESVTGLRLLGEGPTRFRASPQRSPWIRFSALELLPTLTNRRITA